MAIRKLRGNSGITLLEVTISMALLAILLTIAGQAIASYFVTMDMEKERIASVQACEAVMGALREKRTEFQDGFPGSFTAWVDQQNNANWENYLLVSAPHGKLQDHTISVTVTNPEGAPPGANDDLLLVTVTSSWTAMRGRPMRASVQSLLTDR